MANTNNAANEESSRPISIRRKSSSLASQVTMMKVATPVPHPSATSAWPLRAITACPSASASMYKLLARGEHRQGAATEVDFVDHVGGQRTEKEGTGRPDHADSDDEVRQPQ